MKPNFKDGYQFSENGVICSGDGKNQDHDEQASVPRSNNIRPKQDANVRISLRLYAD